MASLKSSLLVCFLLLISRSVVMCRRQTGVTLRESGYEGVVVAIEEDLPVSLCQEVLIGLEESLQAASTTISTATRSWASLRSVSVLVPRSWTPSVCPLLLGITEAENESWDTANIRVTTAQHPRYGMRPWTQQSQGCGKQGDFIRVAHQLLKQNTSLVNGRLLAHEWLRYRYGVFEEVGEVGNPFHPPHYRARNAQWKPNACGNRNIVESDSSTCDPKELGCDLDIKQEDNPGLTSSFMAFPRIPSVTELCDEGSHDRFVPTRHNLACDGKSVWEVMRASQDFQDSSNSEGRAVDSLVSLRYLHPRNKRIVLLVDDTNVMNSQKRWDFMRKAVRKVVAYDIPDGFRVGLVVFDSKAKVKHFVSPLVDSEIREKVGSSLPRNPSVVGETQRCVLCGLKASLELLKKNGGSHGGNIILVTGGSSTISEHDKLKAQIMLQDAGVTLNLVIYPLIDRFPLPGSNLEYVTAISGGQSYIVPDEGIGEDSRVGMYYGLLDALYYAVGNVAGWRGLPVKIHEAEHPGGRSGKSEGSFLVDPSLSSNINFAIFFYDVGHVGNVVHLISPHNQVIDTSNMQNEDENMNMIKVQLSGSQVTPGLWRYSVDNKADSHQGLFIQVTSKPYSPQYGQSSQIEVRGWTNHPTGEVNSTDISMPLAIFAEVVTEAGPVEGARVTANLTRLGLASNGTLHKPKEIVLLDNGLLGPDMMSGDGVYSRYVPNLTTGKFSVTIYVEGTLGQYSFARHVRLGVLNIISSTPDVDAIPPARVVDLRMAFLPGTTNQISFTWTAPGNDFDYGTADRYMVKVGPTPDLEDGEYSFLENWPAPLEASTIQQHTIEWANYDTVSYVGIYAVDEEGNTPSLSNLVTVFIPAPPTTTASSRFFELMDSNTSPVRDGSATPLMAGTNLKLVIIISGCVVGLLVVCALTYCACVAQKPKKNKKAGEIPATFNGQVIIPDEKKFTDRTDSNESIKKEFMRPVESWSASQLLSSHQGNKRGSVSARSDGTSDHSDSTKKSYTGFSANNDFYGSPNHFQYGHAIYPDSYPPPSTDSYPTPTEGYPTPSEMYPNEGYPLPSETRSYVSSPPSESFLSVSCDLIPGTHGPPGYSAYPGYDTTLRSGKVPPPIPPKPKVMYSPEPYQFDSQDSSSGSPSMAGAEKRVRNVTMV
ncbi:calcium-activated chloride channel regulator 1 [Hyalella azteca]|uniref:Calcium-activated chloride channel regulator 1 n=1 Tax=Hyalella azteca TaxID=294128 RepID=A0A8B7NGX9_HYAAZ|nr:calcium-activated chloride channel regulator 1 [Hyalella azteca]